MYIRTSHTFVLKLVHYHDQCDVTICITHFASGFNVITDNGG